MATLEMWRAQRALLPPTSPAGEADRNAHEREAVRQLQKFSADIVKRGMANLNAEHLAIVAEARTVRDAMRALAAQADAGDMTATEAAKAWDRLHRTRELLGQRQQALAARLEHLREPAERPVEHADRVLAQYNQSPFLPPLI